MEIYYGTWVPQKSSTPIGQLADKREDLKKTVNFEDIVIKGGWVLVSKPNFFYIRNLEKYQRWVGIEHRCHDFKCS